MILTKAVKLRSLHSFKEGHLRTHISLVFPGVWHIDTYKRMYKMVANLCNNSATWHVVLNHVHVRIFRNWLPDTPYVIFITPKDCVDNASPLKLQFLKWNSPRKMKYIVTLSFGQLTCALPLEEQNKSLSHEFLLIEFLENRFAEHEGRYKKFREVWFWVREFESLKLIGRYLFGCLK